MGSLTFEANGVPAGATKEIIGRYMVAAKCGSGDVSRKMGRANNYVDDLLTRNKVRVATEEAVFRFMQANWPVGEPKPRLLTDYGKWPAKAASNLRACLNCETPFESEGIHNRMCPVCRRATSGIVKEFL